MSERKTKPPLTVWEFPLSDRGPIEMPVGAELLHIAVQGSSPQVWARVNPDHMRTKRLLVIRGTGHEDAGGVYVGTFHYSDGLVFHVFDLGEV